MGKYRTKSMYACPYCHLVGWQKTGDFRGHIRKSHPDKDAEHTVKNWHKICFGHLLKSRIHEPEK